MTRRGLLVLLVGLNLGLLVALVSRVYTPDSAYAQAAGARPGSYMLVAGRAEVGNDAVYLIDAANRQLHIFRSTYPRPAGAPVQIFHVGSRDLARDFAAAGAGDRR